MKTAWVFLLIGCCLFGFLIYRDSIRFNEAVDIRFGYAYITAGYPQFVGVSLLLLLNFFTLGGVLGTAFRKKGFLALLFMTALLDSALAYVIVQLLNS